uniref:DUF1993 domain-containing protein n=1 Tax=uncultured Erythrobacter sp. TaxID=263913 RepID=UPI00262FABC0|nr:DUF1993 domain-containing protein [uncultured Erythrobacter sp.]
MNLYSQSIAVYRSRLDTISGLLAKAAAHPKGDALLESKLADDMHPLATQIRFVGNLPGEALPRLTKREFASRDDNETTIAGAQAVIEEMKALLDSVEASELVPADETLVIDLPNGMQFTLTAEQYVQDWSLTNFYFHLTTAYAILRMEGLDIGKIDFMPHMMKHVSKMQG